jgi:hypothetical protein
LDLGSEIYLQNKAEPSYFVKFLSFPPGSDWVCSIADSGKIHVAPYAVVNYDDKQWCVRFEREDVRSDPNTFHGLHGLVVQLLDAKVSKTSITHGDMTVQQWRRAESREAWQQIYPEIRRYRGTAVLRLVLFLSRRSSK